MQAPASIGAQRLIADAAGVDGWGRHRHRATGTQTLLLPVNRERDCCVRELRRPGNVHRLCLTLVLPMYRAYW